MAMDENNKCYLSFSTPFNCKVEIILNFESKFFLEKIYEINVVNM